MQRSRVLTYSKLASVLVKLGSGLYQVPNTGYALGLVGMLMKDSCRVSSENVSLGKTIINPKVQPCQE